MLTKSKLNPIFPFNIQKAREKNNNSIISNDNSNIKIIVVKSGKIEIDNHEISKKSILYSTQINNIKADNIESAEFYLIQIKKIFIDDFLTNQYEKNIFEELFHKNYKIFKISDNLFLDLIIIIEKMLNEYINKKTGYHSIIKNKFIEFIITLYRNVEKDNLISTDEKIKIINNFIQNNYTDEISLQKLSKLTASNPSYISRIFKNKTGETIFESVNRIRIEKACHLLKRTKMTVLEISMTVGYNNLSFFNRYFKKIMNLSPTEYRNLPY